MKIPGIVLSIPEKRFLLSFLSVFIFYFLGLTKFRINKSRIFFEFQKSNFCIGTSTSRSIPAPDNHRAFLIAVSAFLCSSLLSSLVFQPRDMHQESLILRYALYQNIQQVDAKRKWRPNGDTKRSGDLAFLDLNINLNEDRKISCHWYQLSTDTGIILNVRSCAPLCDSMDCA